MNSAGPWEESEKENFCKSRKAAELETLVTFLSKFDSKVAAIWEGEGDSGVKSNKGQVWEQLPPAAAEPQEEDLLISPKTHFKPIRDYREEIQPPLAFLPLPQQDPAEYALYNRTAKFSYPLHFKVKTENDKAVQTDFSPPSSFQFPSPPFTFSSSSYKTSQ